MCWCTPSIRTPFCGKASCHPPPAQSKEHEVTSAAAWEEFKKSSLFGLVGEADVVKLVFDSGFNAGMRASLDYMKGKPQ